MTILLDSSSEDEGAAVPRDRVLATNDNLEEYLGLQCKYRILDRVAEQTKYFLSGFYDVIEEPLLSVFDFQELELLLCGVPAIDVSDWMNNSE